MSNIGWETVGKKSKNDKKVTNKSGNNAAEKRIKDVGIEASQTSFAAFMELEEKKARVIADKVEKKTNANLNGKSNNKSEGGKVEEKNGKQKVQSKDKVVVKKEKKKPTVDSGVPKKQSSLDKAAKELNLKEFEILIEETKTRFPDAPLIWLKDIAYYINDKLPFQPEDLTFSNKPHDYPLSLLAPNVRKMIVREIRGHEVEVLSLFLEHTVQTMINNMVKTNTPTLGFRLILQCLAFEFPNLYLNNLRKFVMHRTSYQNRPPICLPILWVVSQAGYSNLKVGLNIWLEFFLPIVGMKAYSKFAIDALENMLKLHKPNQKNNNILDVVQFFILFDFIFTPNALQVHLQKQLSSLYPQLKALTMKVNPEKNLHLYLPSLLTRLSSTSSQSYLPELQKELLAELVECLRWDSQSFPAWRAIYSQYLFQSSILLQHLFKKYNSLPNQLSKKCLKETVNSFKITNDETRGQSRSPEGLEESDKHCQALLAKLKQSKMPLKPILFVLSVSLIIFLAYDTKAHGSFGRSQTGMFLSQVGALPMVEQAYSKVELYWGKGYNWCSDNIPIYWSSASAVCSPYLTLFWQKLSILAANIWDSTESVRAWANKTIPPVLEKITDQYFPKLQALLWQFFSQVHSLYSLVWSYFIGFTITSSNWLTANVLTGSFAPENMQKFAVQLIESLQSYASHFSNWMSTQLKAIIN